MTEIMKAARSRAEAKFTATQKKGEKLLKEKEKQRKESAEKLARLRALRLERESAEKGEKSPAGDDQQGQE